MRLLPEARAFSRAIPLLVREHREHGTRRSAHGIVGCHVLACGQERCHDAARHARSHGGVVERRGESQLERLLHGPRLLGRAGQAVGQVRAHRAPLGIVHRREVGEQGGPACLALGGLGLLAVHAVGQQAGMGERGGVPLSCVDGLVLPHALVGLRRIDEVEGRRKEATEVEQLVALGLALGLAPRLDVGLGAPRLFHARLAVLALLAQRLDVLHEREPRGLGHLDGGRFGHGRLGRRRVLPLRLLGLRRLALRRLGGRCRFRLRCRLLLRRRLLGGRLGRRLVGPPRRHDDQGEDGEEQERRETHDGDLQLGSLRRSRTPGPAPGRGRRPAAMWGHRRPSGRVLRREPRDSSPPRAQGLGLGARLRDLARPAGIGFARAARRCSGRPLSLIRRTACLSLLADVRRHSWRRSSSPSA